jgi:hypothetical protein
MHGLVRRIELGRLAGVCVVAAMAEPEHALHYRTNRCVHHMQLWPTSAGYKF